MNWLIETIKRILHISPAPESDSNPQIQAVESTIDKKPEPEPDEDGWIKEPWGKRRLVKHGGMGSSVTLDDETRSNNLAINRPEF